MILFSLVLSLLFPILCTASPSPTAVPEVTAVQQPLVTPTASLGDRHGYSRARRDIISDVESVGKSILTALGSDVPSYVLSGIPQYFQGFPTGSQVQSSLSLSSSDVAALPTNVLNIPPYANWTTNGWNVRFHGNVYKTPDIPQSKLDDLANIFLIGTSVQSLPAAEASQARNLTAEIFVIQQSNVRPTFSLAPVPSGVPYGMPGTPGPVTETIQFPINTTAEGDYDYFIPITSNSLTPGNTTGAIQEVAVYTEGAPMGNATAYLFPPEGLLVVSDIDDILRVTKIYEPKQGLLNSFARPFEPWMNMPSIYANWSRSITSPQIGFHYLTTTPEQVTRNYMSFIYANYPSGSFDTRPLNFSNVAATLSIRKYLLIKLFETFPTRKFVLVADTSNSDVMRDYPDMYTLFPDRLQCILLRNTSATDAGDRFPYDTSGFRAVPQERYMFFRTPDDLTGLDIQAGHCWNRSVQQNVTFGYQGLPFGINAGSGTSTSAGASGGLKVTTASIVGLVAAAAGAWNALW